MLKVYGTLKNFGCVFLRQGSLTLHVKDLLFWLQFLHFLLNYMQANLSLCQFRMVFSTIKCSQLILFFITDVYCKDWYTEYCILLMSCLHLCIVDISSEYENRYWIGEALLVIFYLFRYANKTMQQLQRNTVQGKRLVLYSKVTLKLEVWAWNLNVLVVIRNTLRGNIMLELQNFYCN